MKKALKVLIPILLTLSIVFGIVWYLLIYDREFTRDMLLQSARYFDSNGNHAVAAWFYDRAYEQAGNNDAVAIELAEQHKADGNYTQAEATLARAIEDGGGIELYIALSQTYIEQDKILDAVKLLNGITNPETKAQLDSMRPAAPIATPEPGFYNQYISVSIEAESGTLYVNAFGEYPSIYDEPYSTPIVLVDGENTIYAVAVADNGLVSPLSIFGYTVGGVIEEVTFEDKAFESYIRELLGVSSDEVLFSNDLWDITSLVIPENVTTYADLKYLPFLEELTIANGPSSDLRVLSALSNLKYLSISNTAVSTDDLTVICTLSKMEHLTLSGCGLSTIAGLENLSNLSYLDISDNTIRNIAPIASLKNLEEAYLQHNVITDVSSLSNITSLKILDISYNTLTDISSIGTLTSLNWLNASYNQINDVTQVGKLSSLKYLDFAFNTIADVSVLSKLINLTELNISNNVISDITSLSALIHLQKFNFSNNEVTELPAFSTSCDLVTIDGSHNQISSLEPLSGLDKLNGVYMDYNEEIDSIDCLIHCHNLIIVNVYGTKVTEVKDLTDMSIVVNFDPTQD